ncbi:hypothetical protein [uncultured Paracoccus sp.]|jgi:hypothetical protein|uniref:hypothetical protein n=1 Tax=uncultured Paracoccus sp. TaxID=189685 RepID=UPI00262A851A|nr:hypothetical protein [uncultured Paracoccus sp.]
MKSDLVDVTVALHAITERAIKVSPLGESKDAVWIPISQVEVVKRPGGNAEITMPEWLAIEKGLV